MNEQDKSESSLILFSKEDFSIQRYNPTTNEIKKFHPATTEFIKADDFTAVILDSYLYVFFLPKSVYRLDFNDENSTWERMQDMMVEHGVWPPAVPFRGAIYMIGSSGTLPINDVERFDPADNKWVKLNDRPDRICDATFVTIDDTIYSVGGWLDIYREYDAETNIVSTFTPSTSKWTNLEPMKMKRHYCGAVAVDKKIYVIAGCNESVAINDVECYDVTTAQWSSLSCTVEAHEFNRAFCLNGWIYTVSRNENSNVLEKYDIANDKWHKINTKGAVFEITEAILLSCDHFDQENTALNIFISSSAANNARASGDSPRKPVYVCRSCQRTCKSRIGLYSHMRRCNSSSSTCL